MRDTHSEDGTSVLKYQVSLGKTNHAYLFCGTRGTGKTSVAKIFAKAVNCEHPVNGSPCGECEMCRSISEGRSMNVIEIDAASNNGVDNIREIREEVAYRPTEGKYKVYIIDEVHMLSIGAFNALLKTLEEPPEYAIIILLTNNVDKFLPTILSRCIVLNFKPVQPLEMIEYLEEQLGVEKAKAKFCTDFAQGNLGKAVRLAISPEYNEIKEDSIRLLRRIHEMEMEEII